MDRRAWIAVCVGLLIGAVLLAMWLADSSPPAQEGSATPTSPSTTAPDSQTTSPRAPDPVRRAVRETLLVRDATGAGIPHARAVRHRAAELYILPDDIVEQREADEQGRISLQGWDADSESDLCVTVYAEGFVPARPDRDSRELELAPRCEHTLRIRDLKGGPVANLALFASEASPPTDTSFLADALPAATPHAVHVARADRLGLLRFPYLPAGSWILGLVDPGYVRLGSSEAPVFETSGAAP